MEFQKPVLQNIVRVAATREAHTEAAKSLTQRGVEVLECRSKQGIHATLTHNATTMDPDKGGMAMVHINTIIIIII